MKRRAELGGRRFVAFACSPFAALLLQYSLATSCQESDGLIKSREILQKN